MLIKIQAFHHVAEDPEDRGFYIFMLKQSKISFPGVAYCLQI
jgi:hypothetical protein